MPLNLHLLPVDHREKLDQSPLFCGDCVTIVDDKRIFGQIIKLCDEYRPWVPTESIPKTLSIRVCSVEGVIETRVDFYFKETLRYAFAKDLRYLKVSGESRSANKAAKAYINHLPELAPVILLWSVSLKEECNA